MQNVLEIQNLRKEYATFTLKDISFSLPRGYIMGFIGPNGAGKTTTLKLIMNLIRADSGTIQVFGRDHMAYEREIKQKIGFVFENMVFYESVSIEKMTDIIRPFYNQWDEKKYEKYIRLFDLDEKKKIRELSKGMRTKYALALALCRGAELLIMDEPTAGLDPVFRRELLDILQEIIEKEENSILFSSHITSDLDRIADFITFIDKGEIVFSEEKDSVFERFRLVKGGTEELTVALREKLIGVSERATGFEGLLSDDAHAGSLLVERPSLEDIMFFHTKGAVHGR